jgi:GNAT superfamily N-acetyltransferase
LREKSDEKVKYEILKPAQIPMVQRLMYESGYTREPMVKHLGLCKGLFSIPDSDKLMEDLIMTYNMSLLAKSRTTNIPLGVVINGEFNIKDVLNTPSDLDKKIRDLSDPGFGPILAIRHELDNLGSIVFPEFNTNIIFNTKFLMVKPEMSMQGLATGLLSRAIQQASALGYKGIKTVVSHNGFKKAAMDNGMKMVAEIKFDEFSFKGKKVFSGIKDHSSCAFMAMEL